MAEKKEEKPNEEKEKLLERKIARREFLKISGAGVAGIAVGALVYRLSTGKKNIGPEIRVYETASGAIIHDSRLCTGCKRCEINCTVSNDGKVHPYIARVKIGRNFNYGKSGVTMAWAYRDGQMGNFKLNGETCKQCAEPYCANACPVQAISTDENTGARVVNTDICIGCGSCERACPFGMATVDPERKKSTKCLLCYGHPACVAGCPNSALTFVSWEDAIELYKKQGFEKALQA
ncbi:ferredoxin-like protein [Sediminispirochaeta smaragdinae]|jgi:Fe-S-cluster-containing dehydrogenase component|uniref:4Fe-4S ferredoxin iron-sulfur binding domain protein n=1 Tax=Sediminispirochaeta smaragdinae (strain DSM 11293 / JCM 15392 / SEBR 4228) TaxID=573413 RepID=E1R126_SEDSS|nr:ferredoxin-like protein [Sediminispirochaeta smaragdinae]ADK80275.1 4Fe-4S ferredoxin iron-sulfur binding domain protein [Sediminispirochaeta smaragdinae DSM 11293]